MLFTTHAITGAAVGLATGNPILGFAAAIASHFCLDAIPHFDQGSFYIPRDFRKPSWLGEKYRENGEKFKVKRDWAILFADTALALGISLYIVADKPLYAWFFYGLCATGGLLPDIFDTSPFWKEKFRATKIGKLVHTVHIFFHWPLSSRFWFWGILTQAVLVIGSIYLMQKVI